VLVNYPGLQAIWWHRITHRMHRAGLVFLSRGLSQLVRGCTGIEIHPGATLGHRVFIDHGMGVVVGETSIIGDDVTIYQGVTLGGTGKERGKRHPTIEECVVVGVGAAVLGNITIGRGSKVGAGAVVIGDVPPNCTVVGVPGRIVVRGGERVDAIDLHHEDLPDPVVEMFVCLQRRLDRLEARLVRDEGAAEEQGMRLGPAEGAPTEGAPAEGAPAEGAPTGAGSSLTNDSVTPASDETDPDPHDAGSSEA
jgi:serine O-acetyltransferase